MTRRVELDLLEHDGVMERPQDAPAAPAGEPEQAPGVERRRSLLLRLRALFQQILLRLKFKRPEIPFNWKALLQFKWPAIPFDWKALLSFKRAGTAFSWKSFLSWKILVSAGVAVILIATVIVTTALFRQKEAERIAAEQQKQMASAIPLVHEAVFSDFRIDLKDARGHYRFLQCDITLEFQAALEMTEDRKVEIRKVIYLAARKKGQDLIRVSDSGSRFKKEMHDELRNLLGEGALKGIYITRYVLL
jgi:flagellar basal body-associated protein FliL